MCVGCGGGGGGGAFPGWWRWRYRSGRCCGGDLNGREAAAVAGGTSKIAGVVSKIAGVGGVTSPVAIIGGGGAAFAGGYGGRAVTGGSLTITAGDEGFAGTTALCRGESDRRGWRPSVGSTFGVSSDERGCLFTDFARRAPSLRCPGPCCTASVWMARGCGMSADEPDSFTPNCPMVELRKASAMPLSGCTLDSRHACESSVLSNNHASVDRLALTCCHACRSFTATAPPPPPTSVG